MNESTQKIYFSTINKIALSLAYKSSVNSISYLFYVFTMVSLNKKLKSSFQNSRLVLKQLPCIKVWG